MFITHFHADHWLGLPGMLKSFALRDRDQPLTVYGPRGLGELMGVMRIIYGRLPYELSVVELDPGRPVERDGYLVARVPVRHRGSARSATRSSRSRVRATSTRSWPRSSASRPDRTSAGFSEGRPSPG